MSNKPSDIVPTDRQTRLNRKFDDDAKGRFLRNFMITGQIYTSALAAGVCEETIRKHRRDNIDGFGDMFEEALGMFRDRIELEIQRRALEGVDEPIIGGKDRDEIVTTVRRYSDRLLEFLARRHIPEYREKQQLDVNVAGGVMVVTAPVSDDKTWEARFEETRAPALEGEVVKKDD